MLNKNDRLMSFLPCQKLMDMCHGWTAATLNCFESSKRTLLLCLSKAEPSPRLYRSSTPRTSPLQHKGGGGGGEIRCRHLPPWCFDFALNDDQKIAGSWFEIGLQYSPGFPEYCCTWVEKETTAPLNRLKVHEPIFWEQIRNNNSKRPWVFSRTTLQTLNSTFSGNS